ncbi:nucleoside diphosphate kinase, mitochondrial-like isoform X1 [Rhineura floridana]|uniref:nucleoside diphosphate kinase, mitochondrial-like isoform X1 n=1 Tax=Rhineura floridana TaxID=261503 RepID=UPI002AC7FCA0|nr:nucleoside diphosphate kinase, mitochondrial-like isoform X1 [Rhineura floridana]
MGFLQRCVGRSRCLLLLEGQRSLGSLPSSDRGQQYSTGVAGLQERTLIAVKPDGVQRRLVGDVIKRFEKRGFKLVGLKLLQANEGILTEHYHELRRKPFYQEVWEGYNVVKTSRAMVGETNPTEAKPGTIRGDFSIHVSRNVVHASDSVETAQREISLWFRSNELIDWDCCNHKIMYEH